MQTVEAIEREIAKGLRTQGLGGFHATSVEIAKRMIANKQSLGVSCAKCGSKEVYCCATTHEAARNEVACICVHICFGCLENIPAADLVWRPSPDELVRCFHCSRPVPLYKSSR